MTAIQTGNAAIDSVDTRSWLIGHFIDKEHRLRHTQDVELKWATHKAGEARKEWVTGETRTTISILISGTFELEFHDQTVTLTNQGDYVMWGPGTDHKWHVPSDCVMLTVRWPSIEQ